MNAPHLPTLDHPYLTPPASGAAIEVAPGLAWIRMPLPFALDHINLWLLREHDGWTAVDCGYGNAATRALWEQHFAATLAGAPLTRIIATHFHPDHLGNADWLATRFREDLRGPVVITAAEYLTAHAVLDQRAGYSIKDTCTLFKAHGFDHEHAAALEARGVTYRHGVPEAPPAFERMLAGDTLEAGGTRWRVIPGHGHSPEHASLHAAEAGVLISGDMLLPRISTNVSVWASEPDGDPLGRFLDSLAAFEALPPGTLVLPSHGLPFRGIALRVAQLRAHHVARLAELEAALRDASSPLSAAELVPVLFRRTLDLQQRFFAMGEAIAHLNHLWRAGRIERNVAAGGAVRFSA